MKRTEPNPAKSDRVFVGPPPPKGGPVERRTRGRRAVYAKPLSERGWENGVTARAPIPSFRGNFVRTVREFSTLAAKSNRPRSTAICLHRTACNFCRWAE